MVQIVTQPDVALAFNQNLFNQILKNLNGLFKMISVILTETSNNEHNLTLARQFSSLAVSRA